MNYACLKKNSYSDQNYALLPVRHEDILFIKEWRNSQLNILRQQGKLSDEDQENYYKTKIWPSFKEQFPQQVLFSYFYDQQLIGYGGLVHISWGNRRAEVSFLLETARAMDSALYKKDFVVFIKLIKEVAFDDLQFHRLHSETFNCRPQHIALLEEVGFTLEGRLKDHIWREYGFMDSLLHGLVRKSW